MFIKLFYLTLSCKKQIDIKMNNKMLFIIFRFANSSGFHFAQHYSLFITHSSVVLGAENVPTPSESLGIA